MHIVSENIPAEHFTKFHSILCETGGRYIWPGAINHGHYYRVHYMPGDWKKQCSEFKRQTASITEVRRDQWYRRLARRLMFWRSL